MLYGAHLPYVYHPQYDIDSLRRHSQIPCDVVVAVRRRHQFDPDSQGQVRTLDQPSTRHPLDAMVKQWTVLMARRSKGSVPAMGLLMLLPLKVDDHHFPLPYQHLDCLQLHIRLLDQCDG